MAATDPNWKDIPWKCSNCQFLLGIISQDHRFLRIKWRDLYISIEEARSVKLICRRCGRENVLTGEHQEAGAPRAVVGQEDNREGS